MSTTNAIVSQISVIELGQILHSLTPEIAADLQLVDVRESMELEIAHLPGFQMFSLSEFPIWSENITDSLDPHKETLVLCHHGVRSSQMCQWLVTQGFTQVKNIVGGIDAYASTVDPSVPRY
jgi:rhodanese-related sulfurtransferase